MNRKLRSMMREIERRGGRVGLSPSMPDAVAEQFLREVLDCPDCGAEPNDRLAEREPIDRILGGTAARGTARDH